MTLLIFLTLVGVSGNIYSSEFEGTIDYIEKTSKLWGILKVIDNGNNTVTLVDRKIQGYGYALGLLYKNDGWIDEITLRPNESCLLTDGHHTFITYKFITVRNSNITLEVVDKFDARSFGNGIKEKNKRVIIKSYEDEE
jgi:hypothetical protein